MERYYSVKEAAQKINVSASFIYKKAESGELYRSNIGGAICFSESSIIDFIQKCSESSSKDILKPDASSILEELFFLGGLNE
jgi:excisionase family DNA binding protein